MKHIISLYDKKAQDYNAFGFYSSVEVAKRDAGDMLLRDSIVARHPEDFQLMVVGFIDEVGMVSGVDHQVILDFGAFVSPVIGDGHEE